MIVRYQISSIDFDRVSTPFIIGLWILSASIAKICKFIFFIGMQKYIFKYGLLIKLSFNDFPPITLKINKNMRFKKILNEIQIQHEQSVSYDQSIVNEI